MKKGIGNKEVVSALRLKAKELLKDNERLERLIAENKDVIDSLNKSIIALGGKVNVDSNGNTLVRTLVLGSTFKDKVLSILEDGRPRTSRQLYNDFCEVEKETNIRSFYDFSGRFSNIIKKAGIRKYIIPENPINIRYFYGKEDWFKGDILKDINREKIDYSK